MVPQFNFEGPEKYPEVINQTVMSDGTVSPLEIRIELVKSKGQQGYNEVGERGCSELLLVLTLASIWEVACLSS